MFLLRLPSSCDVNQEMHFNAFHASAISGYPRCPTALNSTSTLSTHQPDGKHDRSMLGNSTPTHIVSAAVTAYNTLDLYIENVWLLK